MAWSKTVAAAFVLLSSASTVSHAQAAPELTALTLGAYAETFYQWNFNRPANGVTNFRGFDNRHNAFTLANVALDAQWDAASVIGRLTFQVGHTPSTYYLAEPQSAGTPGANRSDAELWKYLQQAYVGYRFFERVAVTAGLFLSPIGPEGMAVRDNWNWSRSNLFFGLPFYHTGARASYAVSEAWTLTLAAYNGWNSVTDNNRRKSISAQALYQAPGVTLSLLYFGGVERGLDAAEGQPFRHLFDAHAALDVTAWLSLRAHANAGFEPTRFGSSRWGAGALYARIQPLAQLFVAVRGDAFFEHVARSAAGSASALFWPARWVSSATVTLDYRPHPRTSFRLEYRHDHAASAMFYGDRLDQPAGLAAPRPNERAQDTLTLGATTWF